MNLILVDDEQSALDLLEEEIRKVEPSGYLVSFLSGKAAAGYVKNHLVDAAFLDVEMPGMDGLALAKCLKDIQPGINIIFVTGYSRYAQEAFSLHASGYLQKPVRKEDVERELKDLRYPVLFKGKGVWIHTFGNFDVFVDGCPVCFRRAKAKEVLAYLVDRKGATVTKKEIAAVLWEDGGYTRNRQYQLQVLITEMVRALREAGAEKIIRKGYNSFSVDPSQFECDYYRFENWDMKAINAYRGEYMLNYSWAEFTAGGIGRIKIDFLP